MMEQQSAAAIAEQLQPLEFLKNKFKIMTNKMFLDVFARKSY